MNSWTRIPGLDLNLNLNLLEFQIFQRLESCLLLGLTEMLRAASFMLQGQRFLFSSARGRPASKGANWPFSLIAVYFLRVQNGHWSKIFGQKNHWLSSLCVWVEPENFRKFFLISILRCFIIIINFKHTYFFVKEQFLRCSFVQFYSLYLYIFFNSYFKLMRKNSL